MKQVLTIAGHDLSGGAGVTKDLEVFFSLGLHGLSVPTSLVIQGPRGVRRLEAISDAAFSEMLAVVREECTVAGIKIGVVPSPACAKQIGEFLEAEGGVPVVLDPVASAKNNYPLMTAEALKELVASVFPVLSVITPNSQEAERITGIDVKDLDGMKRAAERFITLGPKGVVIKGGHLPGEPTDLLFDGKDFVERKRKRIGKVVHGTGCIFSACLLSFMVLGYSLRDSFAETEGAMDDILADAVPLGEGYGYGSLASGSYYKRKMEMILP